MSAAEFRVHIEVDSEGHRSCPTFPNDTRSPIVILGDSFAFGWGVNAEDSVACRVQATIGRRVINSAVAGDGPVEHHFRLIEALRTYRPGEVVLFTFGGNDLDDIDRSRDLLIADWEEGRKETYRHRLWIPFKEALSRRSHSYVFLSRQWTLLLHSVGLRQNRLPFSRAYLRASNTEYARRSAILTHIFQEMKQSADAGRSRLFVAYVPHAIELDSELRNRILDTYGIAAAEIDVDIPFRGMSDAAAVAGAEFIDLRMAFLGGQVSDFYYPLDGHWTAEAHRLAARAVSERMINPSSAPREIR
jgi:hypothetical protein